MAYIRYTHPPKPHSHPGHGTNVTTPPGSTPPQLDLAPSGSRSRDSGAGGGRSNKERQRLQPLASVARAPLFEVRRVRFTHSPYWHTSVTPAPTLPCQDPSPSCQIPAPTLLCQALAPTLPWQAPALTLS